MTKAEPIKTMVSLQQSIGAGAPSAEAPQSLLHDLPVYRSEPGMRDRETQEIRQEAEVAQCESEQRFRFMADEAPAMIWKAGIDALCTFFNKPWLNFTGRSMEQELGNGWAEGVHSDDLQRCLDIYQSSFNARRPFEMEYRLRRFDGEYRWILDRGAPRFAPNGEFAGYIGSCIDITERKRAEEALRESEERFRVLANGAPVLIWVNGLEGCEFVNRAYLQFLGVCSDVDVQKFNWAQFVHPEDREHYVGAYLDCFARRVPFEAQCRFLHHDGKYRWMKASGLPRFSSAGEFLGYVGSSLDVTDIKDAEEKIRELNTELEARVRERTAQLEATVRNLQSEITQRERAEQLLRRNEEYFRALIENASDIISVVNADATVRYESPSIERVLGYKPEDMIGKHAFDFIHPDDLPRLLDAFNEAIKMPGTTRSAEYRARHRDGSWRFFESFGKTLLDETGAPMIVVNSRDITERKWAEQQIQFLYFTTRAINQAAGFHEALAVALREICTLTGWEYGEAWVPSVDGTRLECSPAWHGDSDHMFALRKHSEEMSFKANEGLPGRVWASNQLEWMNDLMSQPASVFRRTSMARELGLKSAVGVPILADSEVLAVLLFFSTAARAEDQSLVRLFSTIVGQLGTTFRRKQAEQELISSREQLRNLSAYLQSAREEERTHIAREIHDELGQMLTALKIDLSWLAKHLPACQEPLFAKTQAMSKLTDMTIATVKRISVELRPGLLDNLGLAEAIKWQAGEFCERTGIECEVALAPESISLDRERSTILFRIVQEALTNVARHAQATKVRISLMKNTYKLLLRVRDNGKGITPEQIFDPNSLGLIGIRERVHPWGGLIKIKGLSGKGTIVFVSLPVNISPLPHPHISLSK